MEPGIVINSGESGPDNGNSYSNQPPLSSSPPPGQTEIFGQPLDVSVSFDNDNNGGDSATTAFPDFNPTIDEEIPFQPDEGTTKDEAEFGTPGGNIAQSEPPRMASEAAKDAIPRRQRGNSNDRSRMRAEEICHDNFNPVC